MVERIRLILRTKNLSASTFADEIGVQRSAISHILSGRNNPSLEFIQKILRRYPELNTEWVLSGKGEMLSYNLFNSNEDVAQKLKEVKTRKETRSNTVVSVPSDYDETESIQDNSTELDFNISNNAKPGPEIIKPEKAKISETKVKPESYTDTKRDLSRSTFEPKGAKNKKVERIVIFYTDKTFKEFSPED